MPPKRATFISYGNDEQCAETRRFIENAGVILDIRDIEKQPLMLDEVSKLVGHFSIEYFINPLSKSFTKFGLDHETPDRDEVIKMIAEDNTLLRRPIIKTNRLFIIGCDRKRISELLQISMNGRQSADDERDSGPGHQHVSSTSK